MRSNGHSAPSDVRPILLTHLITSTSTTRLSYVKGAGESTYCAVELARRTPTEPISSHLAYVFSQIPTRDGMRPSSASVDGTPIKWKRVLDVFHKWLPMSRRTRASA